MPTTSRHKFIDAALIVTLIVIVLVGYRYADQLRPGADHSLPSMGLEAGCNLHQAPCSVALPQGGRLALSISPHPIPLAKPLQIEVTLEGATADKVELDLNGVTMEMGYNRISLTPVAGANRYIGESSIPVCVTGRMEWRATVILEHDGKRLAAPFIFESDSAGPAPAAATTSPQPHTGGSAADKLDAVDPYVRLNPPGTRVSGAFMQLKNRGDKDLKLVKVATPVAELAEFHTHINEDGVMKMRPVPSIEIKANNETALQPGGLHVMMIDLKGALKEGQMIPITLTLDDGSQKVVNAIVRSPTATSTAPSTGNHSAHQH
jgi:periplasmic copper chaperone A